MTGTALREEAGAQTAPASFFSSSSAEPIRRSYACGNDAISCRAPQHEPSLPLERALWREARGLSLCVDGGPPFREVRPRDAWPLPCGV